MKFVMQNFQDMNIVRDTDKTIDTDMGMDMDMKSLNGHYITN
jgi:hypothetical protein